MTDQLIFLDARGDRLWIAGWRGPWPPPEHLLVLKGKQTGMIAICEEDEAEPEALALVRGLDMAEELRFRLRNASIIPEAAPEGAHWFRGAEYVPETDDA